MKHPDVSAFILSGGESRRMGRDKAWVAVAGVPMIERVLAIARETTDTVAVIASPSAAYQCLGVPLRTDVRRDPDRPAGPLAGIETALTLAEREYVLVLACDLPFLTVEWLMFLLSKRHEASAVLPEVETHKGKTVQGLCAVYHRDILPTVSSLLDQGVRRVDALPRHLATRIVTPEEYAHLPHASQLLVNVNSPQELPPEHTG
ncbi:MAG: molybdenum cofactor guanylyltransferase [Blastocatellia bacterium]|nr:molybdenum cofactor guanylyltransferase [Blastocatellia bacterium]